ncbi:MAG: hypothetical protein U0872_14135 [Planctomycetaceae bacterium]
MQRYRLKVLMPDGWRWIDDTGQPAVEKWRGRTWDTLREARAACQQQLMKPEIGLAEVEIFTP